MDTQKACEDIEFDAVVREVKYKGGRDMGTVIVFAVPGWVVNSINDKNGVLDQYHVRLQTLS